MPNYRIWWLSQLDTELVGEEGPREVPQYVLDQFKSRYGRNGREQLWTAPEFSNVKCEWADKKLACKLIKGLSAGGIVIRTEDEASLPRVGFITTLDCEFAGSNAPPGMFLAFDKPVERRELRKNIWFLIFGQFEIDERGEWKVEPFTDGSQVRLHHPDQERLVRFAESFYERSFLTWTYERMMRAQLALQRMLVEHP